MHDSVSSYMVSGNAFALMHGIAQTANIVAKKTIEMCLVNLFSMYLFMFPSNNQCPTALWRRKYYPLYYCFPSAYEKEAPLPYAVRFFRQKDIAREERLPHFA